MGGSNEKVDYTELSKSSISDKIKPKKKVKFCQQVQVKEIPLEGKKGAYKRYKEKKEKQKHELNKKPQLWERGAAIIVPPVIGLLGGLITLTLITEEISSPFLIAALAAIAITAAIYELEYLLKPELLEKPGKTLKDLVTDSFVKEEKNSRTVSQ
ncbi:hypothetical protein [Wolbachia endosymbiont (group B) of Sphaerophoria taeniata]|uniref:hypothetical protein n=1 Tax=Wolbachia endosymbiont (group B) of Sphaerophoria taeniata TaxID=2954058 RepID=UPI00221EA3BF|nr:hypothetical protein [Wolbachia endosymbiont (group B) of Sphaerophoria taeniata]